MSDMNDEERATFWNRVSIGTGSEEDCWEFDGEPDCQGRCNFRLRGVSIGAHRLAFVLSRHVDLLLIEGLCVIRLCDTKKCVNPSHMTLGNLYDSNKHALSKRKNAGSHLNTRKTREAAGPSGAREDELLAIRKANRERRTK